MIRLKTSVLLACATKIGGLLADAPKEDADNLYRFGEKIGLAFQLQDDFLDVYGDTKVFGKAIGGDIISNKKTFMLINAIAKADEKQKNTLMEWIALENPDSKEKINAVTELYNKIGVDQMAIEAIKSYFNEGIKYLDAVNVPKERKQKLLEYTMELMNREF